METLIIAIACFTAGAVITWIVRKLMFEQQHITLKHHNELLNQYDALKTQYAVIQGNLSFIKQQWEEAKQELNQKRLDLEKDNQATSGLSAHLKWTNEKLETQKQDIEQLGEKFQNT